MFTVKDLKKILESAPDDAPVLAHIEVKDRAYNGYTAKYITNNEDGPYDGSGLIKKAIESNGGAVVISDWRF